MTLEEYRTKAARLIRSNISSRSYTLVTNNNSLFGGLFISVKDGNKGSADMINKLIDSISDELSIQEKSLSLIEQDYKYWIEHRLAQLRSIGRKVRAYKTQTENLILVTDKTDGFYYSAGDDFNNLDYIENKQSTAKIDTSSGIVTNNRSKDNQTEKLEQIEIEPLIGFDVTSDSIPESIQEVPGFELKQIIDRSLDSAWITKVTLGVPSVSPVIGNVLLDYGQNIEANVLEIVGSNNYLNASYVLDIIVSSDSIVWNSVLTQYIFNGSATIPLSIQNFKYIKIFLSLKSANSIEDGKPVYQFHLKEVRLFNRPFLPFSTLYTKPLAILDEDANKVEFNTLALKTCEIFPDDTDLKCFVSFGKDGVYSSYQSITPLNRTNGAPINVQSGLVTNITTNTLDNSGKFPYNYNNNTILNFVVDDTISLNGMYLIRDAGNWSTNNNWFTLVFYLENATELDFRTYNVYINGKFKNTIETFQAGFYTLRINDSTNLSNIKDYISTKSLYIGGYLSTRLDISEFLKIEEDNYSYFCITPVKANDIDLLESRTLMIKRLDASESIITFYVSTTNNITANEAKFKFEFYSDPTNTLTPVLDAYQIKVNKII